MLHDSVSILVSIGAVKTKGNSKNKPPELQAIVFDCLGIFIKCKELLATWYMYSVCI